MEDGAKCYDSNGRASQKSLKIAGITFKTIGRDKLRFLNNQDQ